MIDPIDRNQTADEPEEHIAGGSSSTDPSSDDFAASIAEAQPYDFNHTSENSVERDEQGPPENILKK